MNRVSSAANAPYKPLRINRDEGGNNGITGPLLKRPGALGIKKQKVQPESATSTVNIETSSGTEKHFSVLYRKYTTKKNKTWDGDGILRINDGLYKLIKQGGGKPLSIGRFKGTAEPELIIKLGGYEVSIESEMAAHTLPEPEKKEIPKPLLLQRKLPFSGVSTPSMHKQLIPPGNRTPRHDPNDPNTFVFPKPPDSEKQIVDVVMDPRLAKSLRPHQAVGVRFLYQCIMGIQDESIKGALLADDMGLGKTLTSISLIWTILKQSPYAGEPPIGKRVLVVCPVTLISNWKKEFNKWLGVDQIGVYILDSNSQIRDFASSNVYQVMIAGYERIRSVADDLQKVSFDLVICDEGHRLKTMANKSAQAILSLDIEKKIILSGTPIQNDLGEFYTMMDFLNPGILGTYSAFKRDFELPIMKSRQPGAMKKDLEKGRDRSEELFSITKQFVLRRSAKELARFLPPKTESIIFCKPTKMQTSIYEGLLTSRDITTALGGNDASDHLKAITLLKKVCNATSLVEVNGINAGINLSSQSGKLKVLEKFLTLLHKTGDEKVVIVSGYTQTLDVIETLLNKIPGNPNFFRLDGNTSQKRRQQIVEEFNGATPQESFAFLLSAKSGGVGLNLIGASRLFLFDTDWNPSVDQQAMARIHRDGQTKPVFIYRLLVTGFLDEKIFQRQITKLGLAATLLDGKENSTSESIEWSPDTFTANELRDLFSIHYDTLSNTHDLLECVCESSSVEGAEIPKYTKGTDMDPATTTDSDEEDDENLGGWMTASDVALGKAHTLKNTKVKEKLKGLFEYQHYHPSRFPEEEDTVLRKVSESNAISMIFRRQHNKLAESQKKKEGERI